MERESSDCSKGRDATSRQMYVLISRISVPRLIETAMINSVFFSLLWNLAPLLVTLIAFYRYVSHNDAAVQPI